MPCQSNPKTKLMTHPMCVEKTSLVKHLNFLYTFGGFGDSPELTLATGNTHLPN
jgi:hypothetical protein